MCVEWSLHSSSSKPGPSFKFFPFIPRSETLASIKSLALFRGKGLHINSKKDFFFSQSIVQEIYFFFYLCICAVACLLVKYYRVVEHFAR